MPVVTDVDADARERGIEARVTKISGPEVKLLPETRIYVRNVVLAIFAEILTVGVDHRRSVVVNAGDLLLVNRNDNHHAVYLGNFLHQPHGWTIRNSFHSFIPSRLLFGTEVRRGENFLHADDLHALLRRLLEKLQVFFDIQAFDLFDRSISRRCVRTLNQSTFNRARSEERRVGKECRSRWSVYH